MLLFRDVIDNKEYEAVYYWKTSYNTDTYTYYQFAFRRTAFVEGRIFEMTSSFESNSLGTEGINSGFVKVTYRKNYGPDMMIAVKPITNLEYLSYMGNNK